MRDTWVTRVSNRYTNTLSTKDKAARDFIITNYTSGVEDMMADSIEKKVFIKPENVNDLYSTVKEVYNF